VTLRNAPSEPPDVAPAPAAAPGAVAVAPSRVAGAVPTLFDLEQQVAAETDPYRRDELDAMLFYLRDYADVDGVLPPQFDALIAQEFGR
jgi:hypothetical protein